ncbi:NAD(+) diphosphatase [Demequina sp. SYSU T00039]|uniref:NAD(+) diphosphatase n=1 Tax=Demequina lignilytica TaxID=3051663 RepID=A0AAW7M948_9MICO|nr:MULTISPECIES: NAD(+) diphosphatase [unclassified Demequina]MDN4478235.1 NAD(+) diphosphatase [Demequina sp. SYSU T00039-1]MDN4488315.1 NAD(+) diphosphatase [Demequina sp. SYSU T00039]
MRNPWPLDLPSTVDRAAERRDAVDLAACDAIVVRDGRVLAAEGRLIELAPASQPPADLRVYLGRDGTRDLVALVPSDPAFGTDHDGIGGETMRGLRDLLAGFWDRGAEGARDHELATTAIAISQWHASHPRCSLCGEPTAPTLGGWVRRCDTCGRDHYPRTDPAMIVAVTDPDDRLLLAHAAHWSPRRFSHLAGFVEPGETFEQAVHREVWEEARLEVTDVEYLGSQPWPFPASVMVAFRARTATTAIEVDGLEIAEARFVAREEIGPQVRDGIIVLAPKGSVARRMLEEWYGGPLPEPRAGGPVDV